VVTAGAAELAQKMRALPLETIPYVPESTLALVGIRDTAWCARS
jgi:hypothetical protein